MARNHFIGSMLAFMLSMGAMRDNDHRRKRAHTKKAKVSPPRWWKKGVQGDREMARRRRQIERGILKVTP